MITNRIANLQADYVLAIVYKPSHWQPTDIDDVPPSGELVCKEYVASFEEVFDDLVRCNKLSIERNLDTWAVIQSPGGII